MMRTGIPLTILAAALIFASCEKGTPDRAGRLLTMAGEEAAGISNKLDRFTRQLNIADTQLRTSRNGDAAKTLALARDTLNVASKEEFDDFHRIAGWTAVSQLSRASGDKDLALAASDKALAALNDTQPATARPQYVLSLAGELAELRGKQAAIELLESGAGWAADATARRMALRTFAQRMLSFDAFDNARNTLRRDPDAVWRTDTFLALANQNEPMVPDMYYKNLRNSYASNSAPRGGFGGGGGRGGGGQPMSQAAAPTFQQEMRSAEQWSQDVRYENVFKQGN